MRGCTSIRNQYAHAHWTGFQILAPPRGLFFADLDSAADKSPGEAVISMKHEDAPLLKMQEEYMHYASEWLWYLSNENQLRTGRLTSHPYEAPKVKQQPPLHNPLEEHPLPDFGQGTPQP